MYVVPFTPFVDDRLTKNFQREMLTLSKHFASVQGHPNCSSYVLFGFEFKFPLYISLYMSVLRVRGLQAK